METHAYGLAFLMKLSNRHRGELLLVAGWLTHFLDDPWVAQLWDES